MRSDKFDLICVLRKEGKSYNEIAEAIGLTSSHVSNILAMFKYASEDEVRSLLVDRKYSTYSLEELVNIGNEIVDKGYKIFEAVVHYKLHANKVVSLRDKRLKLKKPLSVADIAELNWCKGLNVAVVKHDDSANKVHVDPDEIIVGSPTTMTQQELKKFEPAPRIMGKATVTPRQHRPAKINRSKNVASNKRATQKTQNILDNANNTRVVSISKEDLAKIFLPDINQYGAEAKSLLDSNGNYIVKRGRRPYIRPNSEGFSLLPQDIQNQNYSKFNQIMSYRQDFMQHISAEDIKSIEKRYLVAQSLIESKAHKLSKTMIYYLSGIEHDNVRFVASRIGRKDKYEEVYPLIIEHYKERNGKVGRFGMALYLHSIGYYFCASTAAKLMRKKGLVYISNKKATKYSSYKGEHHVFDNVLERDFSATYQYEKIVTDVTMIATADYNLYLSAFKDLHTKQIVGYSISNTPNTKFVIAGLNTFIDKLPKDRQVIIHSDQGIQYQSSDYINVLKEHGIVQSMSRKGNCYDNGACESFFGTMKTENNFSKKMTYAETAQMIVQYIEYYNKRRLSSGLGGLSPTAFAMKNVA